MTSANLDYASQAPQAPRLRELPAWVPRTNIAWFALLFAVWILVDISLMRWLSKYAFVVAAPLAIAIILRPNNAKLFVAMVAASLWAWWLKMPYVVNVVIVGAFFSIVILISTGLFVLRNRRMPTMAEIEGRVFPIFRVGVPVVWLFAVLHKTNWDFLNPKISCAVQHYELLRHFLEKCHLHVLPDPIRHPAAGHTAVWMAWSFEFSVPVFLILGLLLHRRFLVVGTVLALGFHFVMSLNGYQNFSALGLAFYIPYLPKQFWRSPAAVIGRLYRRWGPAFGWLMKLVAVGLLLFGLEMWLYSIGQVINASRQWPGEGKPARLQGWAFTTFLVCPVIIGGGAWLSWRRRGRAYQLSPGRVPAWAYVVFALVCFNGLCPFLGLKTENSFAMFSNVLTEGQRWNHVFLPKSMQVFSYQDQMVTVHQLSVPGFTIKQLRDRNDALSRLADLTDEARPFQVVLFEFHRLTAEAAEGSTVPIAIDYDVNGRPYHYDDLRQVPELTRGNAYWAQKLMMFRWVPNDPHGICLH